MDFLFPDTLKSANPKEFGIVKEIEVTGSRVVNEIGDLHKISDFILSPSGCNANNDALGQDWYVTGENAKYRLTSWREGEDNAHTWVKLSDMPHGDVISVNCNSADDNGNVNVAELVCGTYCVSLPKDIDEDDTFVLDKAEQIISGQKTFSSNVILDGFCSDTSGDKSAVTKGYVDGICTALCNSIDALSTRTGDLEKDVCTLKDGYSSLSSGLCTVSNDLCTVEGCVYAVNTCVYALQTDLDVVICSYVHKTGNCTETINGKKTFTDTFGVCVYGTDSQGKALSSCVSVNHDCIKFSTACFTVNPGSAVHLNRLNIANGTTTSDKCTKHISLGTDLPADGSDPTYNLAFTNWYKCTYTGGGDISFNTKGECSTMAFNACGCVCFNVCNSFNINVSGNISSTSKDAFVTARCTFSASGETMFLTSRCQMSAIATDFNFTASCGMVTMISSQDDDGNLLDLFVENKAKNETYVSITHNGTNGLNERHFNRKNQSGRFECYSQEFVSARCESCSCKDEIAKYTHDHRSSIFGSSDCFSNYRSTCICTAIPYACSYNKFNTSGLDSVVEYWDTETGCLSASLQRVESDKILLSTELYTTSCREIYPARSEIDRGSIEGASLLKCSYLTIEPTGITVHPKLTGLVTECISQDEDAINKCFFDTSIVSCSAGEKDVEYTTLPVDSSVAQDVSTELMGWNIFNKYKDVLNLKVVLESISFVTGTPLTDEGYGKEVYLSVEDWLPKEGMGFYLSKEAHTFESENKTIVFTFDEGTEFYSSVGEFNKRFLDDNELHVKFVTVEDDKKTEQKRVVRSRVLADGESSELVAYGGTYLMSPYATIKYKVYVDGKLTVKGNDVVLLNENQLVSSDKVFVSDDTCTQIGIEPSRNLFGVYSCTPDKNGNLIVNSTIIGDCGIEYVSVCNDELSTTLSVNSNRFYTSSSSKYECESYQGLWAQRIESIYNGRSGFCVQNHVLSLCSDLIDSTSFFIGDGESRFVIDQGDGDTYSYLSEYRTKNEAGFVVDVDDGFFKEYYCESKGWYGKTEYNSQEFVLEECEDCSDKNTIIRFTSCHSTTLTGVENWFKEYCSSSISTALPYSCSYGSFGSYGESTITEYWDTCSGDFYATSTKIDPWTFSFSSELYTTSRTDAYPERERIKRGDVEGASLVECSYLTIEPSGITIHPKLTGLVTKCITDKLDATNKEYVDTNVNNSINTIKDFIEERFCGDKLEKIEDGATYYMSDLKDKINQIIDILKGPIQNG